MIPGTRVDVYQDGRVSIQNPLRVGQKTRTLRDVYKRQEPIAVDEIMAYNSESFTIKEVSATTNPNAYNRRPSTPQMCSELNADVYKRQTMS